MLEHCDKDLFIKYRDGTITLDQLKARVTERCFGIKYTVLDDLRPMILPQFLDEKKLKEFMPYMDMIYGKNPKVKELLRPLKPHEVDFKCLKSVKMPAKIPKNDRRHLPKEKR